MGTLTAEKVAEVLARGGSARLDVDLAARFKPGDKVVAKVIHPRGHTRLPRYARGRTGTVVRDHGVFVYPDASGAAGPGKGPAEPQRLYAVRFEARALWGPEGAAREAVYIDLFEPYLDPLGAAG